MDCSTIIQAVREWDIRPDLIARRVTHRLGFRYLLHRKNLPGTPAWHQHRSEAGSLNPRLPLSAVHLVVCSIRDGMRSDIQGCVCPAPAPDAPPVQRQRVRRDADAISVHVPRPH